MPFPTGVGLNVEIGKLAAFASGLLALFAMFGCSLERRSFTDSAGALSQTPPGMCPLLRVAAPLYDEPKSTDVLWGKMGAAGADRQFAELLAHAARENGRVAVPLPFEVDERLEGAGLRPTLQPDDEELSQFVKALDCASYLTADVLCWRFNHVLLSSSAAIEFHLTCRRADTDEALWQAHVRREGRGMSYREIALLALRETFESLKQQDGQPGGSHEAGESP